MRFETRAIHVGEEPNLKDGGYGDVAMPIHVASTYARKEVDQPTAGYEYARTDNPTRNALEKRLASLEEARFGMAFASGLAAETSIFLALLRANDHVIAFDDLYGGSRRLFSQVFAGNFQIHIQYVDARHLSQIENAIQPHTRMIWLETPTNPLMKLCDIRAISELAHSHGLIVVVDNTFASPYFQQPLKLGADIVVHSTTKYLNGHSDSVGGAIMVSDETLYRKIKFVQNAAGAILSPFDSFLVLRGIKTLAVRMRRHEQNALAVARFLEKHPRVKQVYYPGLASHPQHSLACRQMSGFGGMISFELDADVKQAKKFVESLRYFAVAESLGGVESLIELPALMTHASIPRKEREKIGLSDALIRISVGIENTEDLLEDLDAALATVF